MAKELGGLKAVEDADEYVTLVEALKKDGYPVKLGVEVDFAPGIETSLDNFIRTYPWDYVMGSVHFIGDWGGLTGQIKHTYGKKQTSMKLQTVL